LQGRVYGGEQPIVGASIQIYAAGSPLTGGGYGLGSVGLITGTLPVTDSAGYFTLTGLYTLPSTASYLYLVSTGGSSGPGNPVNPEIVLMSTINNCTGSSTSAPLSSSLFIDMNEVSTISTVFALQQFMTPPLLSNLGIPGIGAPGNVAAYTALQDAFETAHSLVYLSYGTAVTHNANWATAATNAPTINTLADILVSCVNSNPTTSNACSNLFADATPAGALSTATNTVQAAWYIAQNPTLNVTTLFNLQPPSPPFLGLASAPATFALPVATSASACQAAPSLLTAANFNILGAATVTNTGPTIITGGNLGLYPGTSVTGFPPGTIVAPAQEDVTDGAAAQAQADAAAAYTYATGLTGGAVLPADLSNITLTPGLYTNATAETLGSGTLTLDAQNDPNAVFIFQIGTTLSTAGGTQIILINGAQAKNITWAVGTSATLGSYSSFKGDIIAYQSITLQTGATIVGRALALNAAVSLDSNTSTNP
jgi:hypothetical protein